MARRDVIEVTCDRCGRTETQSSTEAPKREGQEKPAPEIEASFHGEKLAFNDLCKRCREAVKGYFTRISKKTEDASAPSAMPGDPAPTAEVKEEPKKRGFLGGR